MIKRIYGIIGLIGSSEGRYTEDVTIKFEAEGENTDVTLKLFEDEISCSVKHNELKTFKSTGDEVNLIEW